MECLLGVESARGRPTFVFPVSQDERADERKIRDCGEDSASAIKFLRVEGAVRSMGGGDLESWTHCSAEIFTRDLLWRERRIGVDQF